MSSETHIEDLTLKERLEDAGVELSVDSLKYLKYPVADHAILRELYIRKDMEEAGYVLKGTVPRRELAKALAPLYALHGQENVLDIRVSELAARTTPNYDPTYVFIRKLEKA